MSSEKCRVWSIDIIPAHTAAASCRGIFAIWNTVLHRRHPHRRNACLLAKIDAVVAHRPSCLLVRNRIALRMAFVDAAIILDSPVRSCLCNGMLIVPQHPPSHRPARPWNMSILIAGIIAVVEAALSDCIVVLMRHCRFTFPAHDLPSPDSASGASMAMIYLSSREIAFYQQNK